ncbi:MAG: helix-turn-helix domain-containing protein [Bacteroides sp.]|nr:helix-turn-helix domain-containing protein [Bacteroides sp.]
MGNNLITKNDERITGLFRSIERMVKAVENLVDNQRPLLNGERYLTDREVSEKLKISRRSLQDYRNEGRIPYIKLGGKILYKESDIEKMLENKYREAER